MFSADVTARLRAILEEVCSDVSRHETDTWVSVASSILESASIDEDLECLKAVGYRALAAAKTRALRD
jgi:hypothetical protein